MWSAKISFLSWYGVVLLAALGAPGGRAQYAGKSDFASSIRPKRQANNGVTVQEITNPAVIANVVSSLQRPQPGGTVTIIGGGELGGGLLPPPILVYPSLVFPRPPGGRPPPHHHQRPPYQRPPYQRPPYQRPPPPCRQPSRPRPSPVPAVQQQLSQIQLQLTQLQQQQQIGGRPHFSRLPSGRGRSDRNSTSATPSKP